MVAIEHDGGALGKVADEFAQAVVEIAEGVEIAFYRISGVEKNLHFLGFQLLERDMSVEGDAKDIVAAVGMDAFSHAAEKLSVTDADNTGREVFFGELLLKDNLIEAQFLEDRAAIIEQGGIPMEGTGPEAVALHECGNGVGVFEAGQPVGNKPWIRLGEG